MARKPRSRFRRCVLSLTVTTIGVTALIFAFDYRTYYAEWHDDTFSVRLVFEIVFDSERSLSVCRAGRAALFPIGFLGLFVASWLFARARN
jgi:hypothetical protein